jgi:hypothetical protein
MHGMLGGGRGPACVLYPSKAHLRLGHGVDLLKSVRRAGKGLEGGQLARLAKPRDIIH